MHGVRLLDDSSRPMWPIVYSLWLQMSVCGATTTPEKLCPMGCLTHALARCMICAHSGSCTLTARPCTVSMSVSAKTPANAVSSLSTIAFKFRMNSRQSRAEPCRAFASCTKAERQVASAHAHGQTTVGQQVDELQRLEWLWLRG